MSDAKEMHSGDYVRRLEAFGPERIRRILNRLDFPNDADVGDFGCGTGILLHALGSRSGTYTGIDFSSDFINAAERWAKRENLKNYTFVEAEIVDFCSRNPQAFDVATALDFAEHVETPLAIRIFSAIRGSLRPGGAFYLHTPNLDFVMERAKDIGILPQIPQHIAVRNAQQMRRLLIDCGFRSDAIKIEAIPHYNILKVLHPLSALPILGRLFEARLLITACV